VTALPPLTLAALLACTASHPGDTAGSSGAGGDTASDGGAADPAWPDAPPLATGTAWRLDASELGLDTSASVGFGGPGVSVGDLDGDAVNDIAWVSPRGWGLWLQGDGGGGFSVAGELPGGIGVSAADPDGDGDLDLLVVGPGEDLLLDNDGSGSFTSRALVPGDDRFTHSASWTDLDGDGDLDLFLARYMAALNGKVVLDQGGIGDGNQVFLGDGSGTLTADDSLLDDDARDGLSFHGAWVDVDGDIDPDLYVVNDFGATATENRLLRNDGGRLVDATDGCACDLAQFSMGVGVGDPDSDGDADLFVTNLGPPRYLANDGSGAFVDAGAATGLTVPDDEVHDASWAAGFVDVDLDGREDLAVTFGQLNAPGTLMAEWLAKHDDVLFENAEDQPDVLLHNLGDAGFTDEAAAVGFDETGVVRTMAMGDLDGDPQPELVRGGLDFLLVWDPGPTPYDGVVLTLDAGAANRFGVGARVEADIGGRTLTRWMQPSSQGSFSSSAAEIFLGLGDADSIDELRITWPDGEVTVQEQVPAGRVHVAR